MASHMVDSLSRFASRATDAASHAADGGFEGFVDDLADWVADGGKKAWMSAVLVSLRPEGSR